MQADGLVRLERGTWQTSMGRLPDNINGNAVYVVHEEAERLCVNEERKKERKKKKERSPLREVEETMSSIAADSRPATADASHCAAQTEDWLSLNPSAVWAVSLLPIGVRGAVLCFAGV